MTDEFLRDVQAQWRATPAPVTMLHARLRRTRWVPHLLLAIEVTGALGAFLVGLYYFAEALRTRELLFILSAVALLAGMPLAIAATIRIRRDSMKWEEETPDSILSVALRRVEASLKIVRLGRLGIATVTAFTLLLWLTQAIRVIDATKFLLIYSGVSLAICVLYHWWLRIRERRLLEKQAYCIQLRSAFGMAETSSFSAPSFPERS